MEKQPEVKKSDASSHLENNSTLATEISDEKFENQSIVSSKYDDEEDEDEIKRKLNRTARLYFNVKKYTQLEDRSAVSWPDDKSARAEGDDQEKSFQELLIMKRDEKIAKFTSLGFEYSFLFSPHAQRIMLRSVRIMMTHVHGNLQIFLPPLHLCQCLAVNIRISKVRILLVSPAGYYTSLRTILTYLGTIYC